MLAFRGVLVLLNLLAALGAVGVGYGYLMTPYRGDVEAALLAVAVAALPIANVVYLLKTAR
jgi:hypothetical protein